MDALGVFWENAGEEAAEAGEEEEDEGEAENEAEDEANEGYNEEGEEEEPREVDEECKDESMNEEKEAATAGEVSEKVCGKVELSVEGKEAAKEEPQQVHLSSGGVGLYALTVCKFNRRKWCVHTVVSSMRCCQATLVVVPRITLHCQRLLPAQNLHPRGWSRPRQKQQSLQPLLQRHCRLLGLKF